MALNSTVYKITLQLSDLDHHIYGAYPLTIAKHPSETEERLMVRLLCFALYAHRQSKKAQLLDSLSFARALCEDSEPDIWLKDLTGGIVLWIDVGLPSEKSIKKACGRADEVVVVLYGERLADIWWKNNNQALAKCNNLTIINVPHTKILEKLASRNLNLGVTLQEGQVFITNDTDNLTIEIATLMSAQA